MWFKNIILFFVISFMFCGHLSAQQTPVKKDSTAIYKNIETYSKQSKFKTFMYQLIFKPVASGIQEKRVKKKEI